MIFHGSSLWGGVVSGGISQLQDTRNFASGQMNKSDFAVKSSENVTGALGVMAGIEYGAVLGSAVLPGIGTAVGGIVGALVGDSLGRMVGHRAGDMIVQRSWMPHHGASAREAT